MMKDDIEALQRTTTKRTRVRSAMDREWAEFDKQQKASLPASEWLTFDQWLQQSGFPQQMSQIQATYDAQLGKLAADTLRATNPMATAVGDAQTYF